MSPSDQITILSTEPITLNGGLKAERWVMESKFGQFDSTITAIDEYTIIVGGLGDEELIEQIILTLRAIDTTASLPSSSPTHLADVSVMGR